LGAFSRYTRITVNPSPLGTRLTSSSEGLPTCPQLPQLWKITTSAPLGPPLVTVLVIVIVLVIVVVHVTSFDRSDVPNKINWSEKADNTSAATATPATNVNLSMSNKHAWVELSLTCRTVFPQTEQRGKRCRGGNELPVNSTTHNSTKLFNELVTPQG